jgi:Flagellar assembly protein FliH
MTGTENRFVVRLNHPLRGVRVADRASLPGLVRKTATPSPSAVASQKPAVPTLDNELVDALFDRLFEWLGQLEKSRRDSTVEMHQMVVELAVAIGSKLLFRDISGESELVRDLVQEMLARYETSEPVRIWLDPDDLAALGPPETRPGAPEHVTWIASPGQGRGNVRMDLQRYSLFYDGVQHLTEIRQGLLELLNDAEIERRKTGGPGSLLRRFPERRASG